MSDPAQPQPGQPEPAPPAAGGPRYFPDLPPAIDLPAMEHDVLARWQDGKFFERSLEATAGRPLWTFYEGPPTTNGMPGVHHIEARVFKDVFPRFKTMQGFHVPRQGGWDCHGLPVEVAVERELGLSGKKAIEGYGIAEFNARCRESAQRHVDAFEELTVRLGYWVDLQHAYRTMDTSYIESVWWSLKEIFTKGLLVKDFRISPYCPRCETPLSDHEMGQPDVYRQVSDPGVTVRFPLLSLPDGANPLLNGADLLVWTTTPWTLVSNTAVAVHPDESYAVARKPGDGDTVVVAEKLVARVLGEGWHVVGTVPGAALVGATYRPPFGLVEIAGAHRVVPGGFVTTEDGTGLVHLAPAFGADDMETSRAHGLPVVNPVRPDGRFEEWIPLVGGMFFKDADEPLVRDLTERGLLFRVEPYEHSYPHCWRCHTPLLYYALPSWYIRTTQVKDLMLAENERTTWQPPTIKHGRYGEWLRNNVDWALSRTRYWGTPLPIWECGEQHLTCAGSLAELSELAGRDLSGLDPHRPYVDEVTLTCPECGGEARRVPEVIDAWYDSGSMPFARLGAPWQNAQEFRRTYPAQFICEAIDQTRGWFYSLMAVGCLVFGRNCHARERADGQPASAPQEDHPSCQTQPSRNRASPSPHCWPERRGDFPARPRPSTCRPWSTMSWPAGRTGSSSSVRWKPPQDGRCGPSTRDRRRPTACPACITSRPGCSRTCSPASRPCRDSTSRGRAAGTATGSRSRWPWSANSTCPARRPSRATGSRSSTRGAASRPSGTWTRSRN